MKPLLGVLAAPLRLVFAALGWPFRSLPFCALVGVVVGSFSGFLMSVLLLERPAATYTTQQLIVTGLLFGFTSFLLVLFLFGTLLRYVLHTFFAAALGNALVTTIVVVFVCYWMQMPALSGLMGLLIGVGIGSALCWLCGLRSSARSV